MPLSSPVPGNKSDGFEIHRSDWRTSFLLQVCPRRLMSAAGAIAQPIHRIPFNHPVIHQLM